MLFAVPSNKSKHT